MLKTISALAIAAPLAPTGPASVGGAILGGAILGGALSGNGGYSQCWYQQLSAYGPYGEFLGYQNQHILDDVRAGERTPQFRRQSELCYGEHLVEPFQDRGGNALPVLFEMPGKIAKKRLGL
jgi:hypothetical protein